MKKQDSSIHVAMGANLKYHRARHGYTIEVLAEKIGTAPRYLQDLERGKVGASLTTLKNLCDALEVSADALLYGEPAGIDALLRGYDRTTIENIEDLVRLQLKIIPKQNQ